MIRSSTQEPTLAPRTGRRRRPRRVALAGLVAAAGALALTACTPSRGVARNGTVAIQARKVGIPLTSADVTCRDSGDQMRPTCTAPIGPGASRVEVGIVMGWIEQPKSQQVEIINVTIPASLGRGAFRRTETGWTYHTNCSWRPDAKGTWKVSTRVGEGCHTSLIDDDGQLVKEV